VQIESAAVFIQMQLMKHIYGSRSIPGRFESEVIDIYLAFDLQLSYANEQQTGPFLEISHFSGKYFPRKIGDLSVAYGI
jgi:hypothetical protein